VKRIITYQHPEQHKVTGVTKIGLFRRFTSYTLTETIILAHQQIISAEHNTNTKSSDVMLVQIDATHLAEIPPSARLR